MKMRELDGLAGLRWGHVRYLELEPRPGIQAETLAKIANVFGVSLDWLYGRSEERASDRKVRAAVAAARAAASGLRSAG